MRIDVGTLDRYFRYTLLGLALILGGLDHWIGHSYPWIKPLFVIVVAGMVGYFTNFLAIKMLFQPKRGHVLGWRGLVPKNQAQIAQSLGANVQEQLLSPDIILAYIRERQLIEAATQSLADWLDRMLQDSEVRRSITARLIGLLDDRGAEWINNGFDFGEQALKRMARNPTLIASYWEQLRAMLVEFVESDANRALIAKRLQSVVQDRMPQIARWLDHALEDYLRSRGTVSSSLGLSLKSLISLDKDAIEHLLARFADDPAVSVQLMQALDGVIDGLQRELEAESTQALVLERLAAWIEQLADLARRHLLPGTIEQLRTYLNDEGNWATIEEELIGSLSWAKDRAVGFLAAETGQRWLRELIERAVQRLNVTELVQEQVMKLDTDELEAMVLDNTGGNLTIIQVLGGVLGIIAGTVQVHLLFAVPIGVGVGVVYIAWRLNERKHAR